MNQHALFSLLLYYGLFLCLLILYLYFTDQSLLPWDPGMTGIPTKKMMRLVFSPVALCRLYYVRVLALQIWHQKIMHNFFPFSVPNGRHHKYIYTYSRFTTYFWLFCPFLTLLGPRYSAHASHLADHRSPFNSLLHDLDLLGKIDSWSVCPLCGPQQRGVRPHAPPIHSRDACYVYHVHSGSQISGTS